MLTKIENLIWMLMPDLRGTITFIDHFKIANLNKAVLIS